MIDVMRIVEYQASLSSYRATQNEERATQLELLIEATKPSNLYAEWHPLIATPFRYSPPHPQARFRPLYGKNVFYSSLAEETALYEHAFHFIRERRHLSTQASSGNRTLFAVAADDREAIKIKNDKKHAAILDKNDYTASHDFILAHPHIRFILYPSCRDPARRENAAVLDINQLEKNPAWEKNIRFFYDNQKQELLWIDQQLHINWREVC